MNHLLPLEIICTAKILNAGQRAFYLSGFWAGMFSFG